MGLPSGSGWCVPGGLEWAAPVAAYLLGSIPFGLVLVRMFKGIDLRSVGSGNIGATNARRAGGKPIGYAVFALDVLKGFAPAFWLAPALAAGPERVLSLQVICGALAVLGHCFPLYLMFKGGKAVSTGCGALLALDPLSVLIGGVVWLIALYGLRYTGLASILMGLAFPIAVVARGAAPDGPVAVGAMLLALLIVVRHRSNIRRMLAGTEPKIGADKSQGANP
jgi:glycerol-3-phosphate acyltransferase PlsY